MVLGGVGGVAIVTEGHREVTQCLSSAGRHGNQPEGFWALLYPSFVLKARFLCVCVCVCVTDRQKNMRVCVCMCEREKEGECVCVLERGCVCMYVCERGGVWVCEREVRMCVCVCVCCPQMQQ